MNKKKPDLLTILALVVVLGVVATSVAQGMWRGEPTDHVAFSTVVPGK